MTEQRSTLVIEIDSRNAERNARNIARELQSIERTGDFATRSMDSMSVATRNLVGYMGGLVTIGAAVSKMDAYTGLRNRLKLVTDSQVDLNTAMNDTFAIAQKTASSWDSTAMVYQRFADNADRLGISMKQTATLTETVSKAISVSGGSAASAEAALMQFGQALASGVLRGEEFNSIAEQAPGLLKAIAFGLDTNVGSLRAMAGEGKITGDVLVSALGKAKPYIDDLFNRTDFTISQSFTKLSNEVTKFVGEAGAGSGAAAGLSAAIDGLAQNLGTIANIAVVGGVALLTKTILAQTVAVYGSIAASTLRRNNLLAELATQAAASASEVRRTAALAQFTAMQLADAKATAARMTGVQRLAYVQATVIPLEAKATQAIAAHTAVTASDTVVQNANNAARSRGAMIFNAAGGWVGVLTIGVAALAAGYMYLKSRTDEANAKLEEQGKIAQETDESLKKLSGNDKISAVRDLTAAFNDQNEKLAKSKESVDAVLFSIRAISVENEKARKVTEDAKNGVISYNDAIAQLNKMNIPTDLYDMLKKQAAQYDENSLKAGNSQRALKTLGAEFKLSGNAAQNAANNVDKNTDSLNKNTAAAEKAAKAQDLFNKSQADRVFEAHLTKLLIAQGRSESEIKDMVETANFARKNGVKLTNDMYQASLKTLSIEEKNQKVFDARNEAEKKITKEKEKQLKLGQRLIGISGNSGIGTGAHLDVRYGGSRDGQKVSKEHLSRLQAGGKSLSSYRVSSDYGQRKAPTKGASSFHKGIDFAMPVNTPITTSVAVKDVKTAYDSKGGGYYSTVTFEDGVVLKLLHQAPSAMSKIKGGSSDGTLKSNQDLEKQAEDQARNQIQLQMTVASEKVRIETQLKSDIEDIRKAGFSPEETKRLISEYQARADDDIAISQYALKTKLDDYGAFKKTESELLEDSFNEKKFYASRDIELSKDQRNKAVALLDEQLKHEQALLMLANETRLFQLRESLMTETAAMMERYRLEREQILKNSKLSEEQKQREIALSKATQQEESRRRLNTATQQWGGIQADINGTGDQYRLEQERFSRYDASQGVFDSQMALAETAAERESIWQAHHDRMSVIEMDYQARSIGLQAGQAAQFAGIMQGMVSESSSAYALLGAAQQSFALFSTAMNSYTAISAAWASAPFPYNMGAVAMATLETGLLQAAVSALSPKGFANGGLFTGNGHVRGPGTSTSDSINATLSDYEFVTKASSVRKIGVDNMEYMNRTGKLPIQRADGGPVTSRDTHRVGMGVVSAIGSGRSSGDVVVQPQITINVPQGYTAEQSRGTDGAVTIDIVEKRIKKAFGNMSNPNSYESKQVQRNFNTSVKR